MSLPTAARSVARRARLVRSGAREVQRSLPVRRSGEDARALWEDPGARTAILDGLPVADASLEIGAALDDWGTVVTLRLRFRTPMPRTVSRTLAGKAVRRLKALAETGEIPTTERNPSARASAGEDAR